MFHLFVYAPYEPSVQPETRENQRKIAGYSIPQIQILYLQNPMKFPYQYVFWRYCIFVASPNRYDS